MNQKAKILLCTNNPEASDNAITYACLLAQKYDNIIELLTILDNSLDNYQGLFSVGKKLSSDRRNFAEEWLAKLADDIFEKYSINSVINIKEGLVSDQIETTIKNDKTIKMLVLSSSPDSSSKGKFIPHLTEKILDSSVPIVIIPSSLTKTEIKNLI
jgi:hypothetical protein